MRIVILSLLLFSPLFAKQESTSMSCGCPCSDYAYEGEPDKRCLPGPINGIVTSMKCCPGIWTVGAAAVAVGAVAIVLSDSPSRSTGHLHS